MFDIVLFKMYPEIVIASAKEISMKASIRLSIEYIAYSRIWKIPLRSH
jgi:hypothetical protein